MGRFVLALGLLLVLPLSVAAQRSSSTTLAVSATVLPSARTTDASGLHLTGGRSGPERVAVDPATDDAAGRISASDGYAGLIQVVQPDPGALVRRGGEETIVFTPSVAAVAESGGRVSRSDGAFGTGAGLSGEGGFVVRLGGAIDTGSAVPGSYEGTMTVTLIYLQ